MTNKDLIQALSTARGLLYSRPFVGDQMMAVSECVRILDAIIMQTNTQSLDSRAGDQNERGDAQ